MKGGTIYRRLLLFIRPFWKQLVAFGALSLLAVPFALLLPLPLKIVVDNALNDQPLPAFVQAILPESLTGSSGGIVVTAVLLLITVTVLQQLQLMGHYLLYTWISERVVLRFRTQLFSHVQRLSLTYHDTTGSADSLYRIQYDAMAIQWVAIDGVIPYIVSAATIVAMLVVTWSLDPTLALLALCILPLLWLILHYYRPRLRTRWREVKDLESSALSVVQETLGAVRIVKAFGQEEREQDRFVRQSGLGLSARLKLAFHEGAMGLWIGLTMGAGAAAVMIVGVGHVRSSTLTLGSLLLVMGYVTELYAPMKAITGKIAKMQSWLASAERAFALLDRPHEVEERPNALPLARATGRIEFSDVTFGYDEAHPVLSGVAFEVEPGSRVGIVGRTGAGKTTLVNLLMRFYDPNGGQILLDGSDVRDLRVADLRNQFSMVPQEPVLFSTSISENIAYARAGATQDEIEAAARMADAHEFITRLPDGYGTLVGERGMRLSGGERQRIALARAFLKDAPMLILDEPTSSVDIATETSIMQAMVRLMENRTTFMIAHRLSTLDNCDVILRVEDGRVRVESGPSAVREIAGA